MYGKGKTGYRNNTQRHDPMRNYNFEVAFVGKYAMYRTGFSQVSGLKVQSDFKEYKEGGNNGTADQIPMDTKFEPIDLTGGMVLDTDLVDAFAKQMSSMGHKKETYTVHINKKDRNGVTLRRTTLTGAWISRYEEGDLDASGSAVLVEKITLQFTGASVNKGY